MDELRRDRVAAGMTARALCALASCASPDATPADVASPAPPSPAGRCVVIGDSIRAAGFADRVTVRCDDRYAYVVSDT